MTNTRTIIAADNFLPSSRKTRILPPSIFWLKFALPQRLVSREGDLWRWDGFAVAANAPTGTPLPAANAPTPTPATPPTPEPTPTPQQQLARIANTSGQGVSVRQQPGPQAPRAGVLREGTRVLLTGNDQTVAARPWREIETEDHNLKGWVLGDFIQLMQPAGGL